MDEVKKPTPSEVLLLEDEEATASAVSQSLTERNFNVYQATSIDEAIRAASSRHVGFVVLDVPVGADQTKNVIEAARGIQELQPNSPIAVISALSNNPDFRRDAEQSGVRVAQWLSKPLDVRQIVRLIESKAEQVKVPNLEEQNTAQADSLTDSESPHHTIFRFPFNRLSANSLDAIRRAERFRQTKGRNEIRLEHLVVGLCDAKRGQASKAFDRAPMSRDQLREALEQVGGTDIPGAVPYTPQRTNSPPLSWDVFDVLKRALPAGYGEVIFTEDLLRAALTVPGNKLSEFLREHTPIGEVLGLRGSVSPPSALSDGDTNAAPTRSASEGSRDSILFASARDQPTKEDHLGFEPYVWAIAEFLASPDTKPPLTLSIEGDWGSGKSSFMLQLEERLRARGDPFEGERRLYRRLWRLLRSSRKEWINCGRWLLPPCCFAVRFNAWRHDKEEALWAAFALEFLHSIAGERFFLRRWWGHLQLFKDRYRWRNGWFDLVRWFGVWSFLFFLAVAAPLSVWLSRGKWNQRLDRAFQDFGIEESIRGEKGDFGQEVLAGLIAMGGAGAYYAGLAALMSKARDLIGSPLEVNLRKYIRTPAYEDRIAFVERFHEDFRRIVDAYAGKHKVYVFIDDMDRCEIPKAADLMQALNLLIADDPRLIFIVGMDREKVAAGLAVKYEKLLPFLMPAASTGTPDAWESALRRFGRAYGYSFLEKFIQLPFQVPAPFPGDMGRFLWPGAPPLPALVPEKSAAPAVSLPTNSADSEARAAGRLGEASPLISTMPIQKPDFETERERQNQAHLRFGKDSDAVRRAALMVAPVLDYNPRRIKQFVNLFRLKAYIADALGLLSDEKERPPVTLEQLAKFVAAGLAWAPLLATLDEHPKLLAHLAEVAEGKLEESKLDFVERCWWEEPKLQSLLRFGCFAQEGDPLAEGWRYSLAEVDMEKLLRVCPQVSPAATESTHRSPFRANLSESSGATLFAENSRRSWL